MEAERVVLRKPLQSATVSPSPNTAYKRKPIPVAVTPPTPVNADHGVARDAPCPHCGAGGSQQEARKASDGGFAEDAQRRITELEAEVRILTGKASAAADKLADYEDELQKLKAARIRSPSPQPNAAGGNNSSPESTRERLSVTQEEEEDDVPPLPPAPAPQQPAPVRPGGGLGRSLTTTRITNFLAARRNSPASQTASPISPSDNAPTEADLNARLAEAEKARKTAETKLTQTNQELEELSASLFQSANDMVSNERRQNAEREAESERKAKEREEQWQAWQKQVKMNERAAASRTKKLEEKVRKLEVRVQTLEDREKSKAQRLERLEAAMKRTQRLRGMMAPMSAG